MPGLPKMPKMPTLANMAGLADKTGALASKTGTGLASLAEKTGTGLVNVSSGLAKQTSAGLDKVTTNLANMNLNRTGTGMSNGSDSATANKTSASSPTTTVASAENTGPETAPAPPKVREKALVAVAIDFGTTFTGVAYQVVEGVTSGRDQPWQIGNWPGKPTNSFKVPTVVCYDAVTKEYKGYGYMAERMSSNEVIKMRIFKLKAIRQDQGAAAAAEAPGGANAGPAHARQGPPRTPAEATIDFLTSVHGHMLSQLENNMYGPKHAKYDVLFTVPGTYRPAHVEAFRKLLMKTPFNEHTITVNLKEPEAAARFTIGRMANASFEENECFILCDAGGGTVDQASYSIGSIEPELVLDMVEEVDGATCGSMKVDKAFRRYMSECVPQDQWDLVTEADLADTLANFVSVKKAFDDDEDNWPIQVSPPELQGKDGIISHGRMKITQADMQSFFSESVNGTVALIQKHVDSCKAKGHRIGSIILVGGLGSSNYLLKKVKDKFTPEGINIYQPNDAEYAVILGACSTHVERLRNKPDPIRTRICPYNFGVLCTVMWDPLKHDKDLDECIEDPGTGQQLARDQIMWLTKKGDKIQGKSEAVIVKEFFFKYTGQENEIWRSEIVTSDDDVPPPRRTKNVRTVLTLESNLSKVGKKCIDKVKVGESSWFKSRKTYKKCSFKIEMKAGVTSVGFAMIAPNGERQSNDVLNVNWDEEEVPIE